MPALLRLGYPCARVHTLLKSRILVAVSNTNLSEIPSVSQRLVVISYTNGSPMKNQTFDDDLQ